MAQAVGVDLSLGQQIVVVLVLMLTSKGMAGIPGSAFLALSATVAALDVLPAGAVALLLAADRLMDTMRVVTNLLGNCVATHGVTDIKAVFPAAPSVRPGVVIAWPGPYVESAGGWRRPVSPVAASRAGCSGEFVYKIKRLGAASCCPARCAQSPVRTPARRPRCPRVIVRQAM